ncbi:MAG: hypothetical protein ACHQ4H_06825, partial [Ktedonobacterales bacterium]
MTRLHSTDTARFAWPREHVKLALIAVAVTSCALTVLLATGLLPFVPPATIHAGSANAVWTTTPAKGPAGTRVTISGHTYLANPGDKLVVYAAYGDSNSNFALCQDSEASGLSMAQLTVAPDNTFSATFTWPAAAGKFGVWSLCTKETTTGAITTSVDYQPYTVTAAPTAT